MLVIVVLVIVALVHVVLIVLGFVVVVALQADALSLFMTFGLRMLLSLLLLRWLLFVIVFTLAFVFAFPVVLVLCSALLRCAIIVADLSDVVVGAITIVAVLLFIVSFFSCSWLLLLLYSSCLV